MANTIAKPERGVSDTQGHNAMRAALAKMPRVRTYLRRPEHIKKGMHFRRAVTINGYCTQVPTGVHVLLADEVYRVLLRAGHCDPITPEDEKELPAIVTQTDEVYNLSGPSAPGTSMDNPLLVI